MTGTKKFYQEGREAFRSSVPYLRADSVDAPSLWELDELAAEQQEVLRGRTDGQGEVEVKREESGLAVPPVANEERRRRSLSFRGRD